MISDVLYAPFINAAFYAAPCLELENEQDSRMQGFFNCWILKRAVCIQTVPFLSTCFHRSFHWQSSRSQYWKASLLLGNSAKPFNILICNQDILDWKVPFNQRLDYRTCCSERDRRKPDSFYVLLPNKEKRCWDWKTISEHYRPCLN